MEELLYEPVTVVDRVSPTIVPRVPTDTTFPDDTLNTAPDTVHVGITLSVKISEPFLYVRNVPKIVDEPPFAAIVDTDGESVSV
jgi:hypothetical protein